MALCVFNTIELCDEVEYGLNGSLKKVLSIIWIDHPLIRLKTIPSSFYQKQGQVLAFLKYLFKTVLYRSRQIFERRIYPNICRYAFHCLLASIWGACQSLFGDAKNYIRDGKDFVNLHKSRRSSEDCFEDFSMTLFFLELSLFCFWRKLFIRLQSTRQELNGNLRLKQYNFNTSHFSNLLKVRRL